MCGLTGFWGTPGALTEAATADALVRMNSELTHRGPDGEGAWTDPKHGIALAHRRLAILDLSDAGTQPMVSHSNRYVITYNGEIYNYRDLSSELQALGHRFRGHSDTEILLAAVEEWGVEPSVRRFNGMFAFAMWDRRDRTLWLARDRLGKKPLHYAICGRTLLFGSQIRSLLASGRLQRSVDPSAVGEVLRYGFIAAPRTILQGVQKLRPGCTVQVTRTDGQDLRLQEACYWRPPAMRAGAPRVRSYQDAKDELRSLLLDAVKLRMVSDVPLGAFLSGGIDSSLVTALMQACASRPVKTFTIGFEQTEFDEARHAAAVARHLGVDHTEAQFSQADLLALVPALPIAFDEPFGDPSQLPTMLLSQLTRRHVTVALSGDGGDELFGGYRRYQRCHQMWRWRTRLGARARVNAARLLRATSRGVGGLNCGLFERLVPRSAGAVKLFQQIDKVAELLAACSKEAVYERLMSTGEDPDNFILGPPRRWRPHWATLADEDAGGAFEWMMAIDQDWYLPDDILVKVDRATMFSSLEARAPLLDYRVVELAARLQEEFKVGPGIGKRILTELAQEHVPRELLERPKQGFGAPLAAWLRGPLREWAEDLLSQTSLARTGILDVEQVRERWASHLNNARDSSTFLWQVLMFKSWHGHHIERTSAA